MRIKSTLDAANGQPVSHRTPASSGLPKRSLLKGWGGKLAAPLILAVLTIYGVNQYLNQHSSTPDKDEPLGLIERIVAADDLAAQTTIKIEHLALREFPPSWVGADSFGADEIEQIIGLQLTEELLAGMPLSRTHMKRPQPNEFLGLLGPGRRAVTLPIGRISSASGLVQPGEMIDLYVTFEHKGRRITSLLIGQIRVLQVARENADRLGEGQESLTLDVSPQQAAKLIAAQQGGVLTAVQMSEQHLHRTPIPPADHLAGYAGVEASFEQLQVPDIIYGDGESTAGAPQP